MLRSWALRSAISEPKQKSLQVSLMVRWESSASSATSEDEAEASSKSVSEKKKPKLKAVVFVLNSSICVNPRAADPNQIVLVGQSPARLLLPCLHYLIVNSSHEGKYL